MTDTEDHDGMTIVAEVPQPAAQTVFDTLYDAGLTPVYLPSPGDILPDDATSTSGIPIAVPTEHAAQARKLLRATEARHTQRDANFAEQLRRHLLASAIITAVGLGVMRLLAGSWRAVNLGHASALAGIAILLTGAFFYIPSAWQDSGDTDA
jgi:hypothetical protein